MPEPSDSDRPRLTAEELATVRRYMAERDRCAQMLGAAWLEFDQLKDSLARRVLKLLAEERDMVAALARARGLEGAYRVDLDSGDLIEVER